MLAELAAVWWSWMALAVALLALEVVTTTYIALGFSIGAFAVSLVVLVAVPLFGIAHVSITILLLLWAVLSCLAWLGIVRRFARPDPDAEPDVNDY